MAAVAAPSSRSSFDSFASSNPARRQYNRLKKNAQVNSFDEVWTNLNSDLPTPLDERFINVKKRLVTPEHYEAVQASWGRLLLALEERTKVIESAGPDYIPTVEFASVDEKGNFPKDVADLIKSRGCCVVRGVVSRQQASDWKSQMISYVKRHPAVAGTPLPASDPQLWNVYWTKAQVEARSHPNIIKCQTAMSKVYSCSADVEVDVTSQVVYADRFRVRHPGEAGTLPAHLDNGSIERWEDVEGSKTYQAIWEGRWGEYDAWNIDHRAEAVVDLYGGPGACSVFRSLQGKS